MSSFVLHLAAFLWVFTIGFCCGLWFTSRVKRYLDKKYPKQ